MHKMILRVVSYNIHHGAGRDGAFHIRKTVQFIKKFQPDLVGLNEVEQNWAARSRFMNLPKVISAGLGKHSFFYPSLSLSAGRRRFGNMILSRYPMAKKSTLLLNRKNLQYRGSRFSEQRTCLGVEIQLPERRIRFLCTHLGLPREERARQVKKIAQNADTHMPTVLVGDFNTRMSESLLRPLKQRLPCYSHTADIDHLFASRHFRIKTLRAVQNTVSDHPLLYAELNVRGEL